MRGSGLVAMWVLVTACLSGRTTFPCATDTDCGVGGQCEQVGFCSFADPECGRRFGEYSGAFSNQCVSDLACGCTSATQLTCESVTVDCELGCISDATPRCGELVPSNGIDPTLLAGAGDIVIGGAVVFNTDTGELEGALTRGPGMGVQNGIAFAALDPISTGGAQLGVFALGSLTVMAAATVTFEGSRAAVFLVGGDVVIAGTIDASAVDHVSGVGGGDGGTESSIAGGCGPGNPGIKPAGLGDSGGGGGGGTGAGGAGGATNNPSAAGGAAGASCMPETLIPLIGGSGGGAGASGPVVEAQGGGGGGGLQITSLATIAVSGTILANGGGGRGGRGDPGDGGSGAGGGAGGGILIEAIAVTIDGLIAANGGGGGGGALTADGMPGQAGQPAIDAAMGGNGNAAAGDGGDGGARSAGPQSGDLSGAAGGGGGGIGAVVVNARSPMTSQGTFSPPVRSNDVVTR